ncbi:3-isopropylmalate dehydratase, large subunit [Metallosphaera sedula]|uniref:3-isopropylmalate dehydratase large subunit n=3 Tax=Metallosphaera TaxID=41980 RepID=LEUC_METS5|nr:MULTISPECIES: 3-isopropylmalate dehydratase large subunit [Metallosphaera]A4YF03.1 RecName: Full=3-isopropylmalate dehydratase large subunit; AltName: Full=Alpha-IPM isomerase; Short=IPMI; AltName: Full=Isopropylmalate isomerase [Metallosphaera sedula DSM 5348]ABP95005.1 3-isopropylmalate dehydratase, large subunit [Metallosphaera sedula DSM 5348]AIM26991.1 3-isopropylmalate dehydratase, large subunit [Metallosphaera sedula]AKV73913.1 3-isopropylmalate dehydratase [Metallosphaera sedula]AKV
MTGTLTEKILSRASGKTVSPGDVIEAKTDIVAFHDLTGYHVIEVMEKANMMKIFDKTKIVVAFDHLAPPPDVRSAEIQGNIRKFVKEMRLPNFHDINVGILHELLIEQYALPGQVIVAADSHTTTSGAVGAFAQGMGASDVAAAVITGKTWLVVPQPFKVTLKGNPGKWINGKDVALELLGKFKADYFNGMSIEVHVENPKAFPMDYRATVSNMGIEMNADALMFVPDVETKDYIKTMRGKEVELVTPDPGAKYLDEHTIELDKLEPLVAAPYSVDNVKTAREESKVPVDQVYIGSCTNGRLSDFRIASEILKGKKVKTRCIAIPSSYTMFKQAMEMGYIEDLVNAGCVVTYGTCGPCLGGHFGVAGPGEVIVSTSSRNFRGRMGSNEAKVYLSGPSVAAASAATGYITDPRDVQ